MLAWVAGDSIVSFRAGVSLEVLFNAIVVVLIALPLVMTYRTMVRPGSGPDAACAATISGGPSRTLMMSIGPTPVVFPTLLHGQAAEAVVEFSMRSEVEAVVLVNSCARGTAVAESDLDVALLVDPGSPPSTVVRWSRAGGPGTRAGRCFAISRS